MDDEVTELQPLAKIGDRVTPEQAMRLAITEAKRGLGYVAPNPMVGCAVIDNENRLVATGYHHRIGGDHAEIDALKKLPEQSKLAGLHFYVTLEPCAHQGRTPSCAKTLAPLRPASVTYAVADPNPVAGRGADILRASGIKTQSLMEREDVEFIVRQELKAQAEDLAEIFLHNQRASEIFVAVKIASSLDGMMALRSGESKWITGEAAREHVQLVRAHYDAIGIGLRTFTLDDPSLNVRHRDFSDYVNKAVVFDPRGKSLDTITASHLGQVRPLENVIVITSEDCQVQCPRGVKQLRVQRGAGGEFNMSEMLSALKAEGLNSLLIEGGAGTIGYFFRAHKVRRLHAFTAPVLIGGEHGLGWSSKFGVGTLSKKISLERVSRTILGDDEALSARIHY